jgi:hypothetical protein
MAHPMTHENLVLVGARLWLAHFNSGRAGAPSTQALNSRYFRSRCKQVYLAESVFVRVHPWLQECFWYLLTAVLELNFAGSLSDSIPSVQKWQDLAFSGIA